MVAAEEDNLLAAWQIARQHDWWVCIVQVMQSLQTLYIESGRNAPWRGLVESIVPQFVDPVTDGPLPGREEAWSLVTQYRVRLARGDRRLREAERLQRARVEWTR